MIYIADDYLTIVIYPLYFYLVKGSIDNVSYLKFDPIYMGSVPMIGKGSPFTSNMSRESINSKFENGLNFQPWDN